MNLGDTRIGVGRVMAVNVNTISQLKSCLMAAVILLLCWACAALET